MATTITANGINFPDGSAGSPSIGGTDTNTGLFTGSDIVGFATGGSERLRIDASGNVNIANDSGKLQLGTSNDLQIYHNGSYSIIDHGGTGDLYIESQNNFELHVANGEDALKATANGAVELYHDNTKTFSTSAQGATVTNGTSQAVLKVIGGESQRGTLELIADDGDDNADYWQFQARTDGNLNIQNYNGGSWVNSLILRGGGATELYHDNTKKFETGTNYSVVTSISNGNPAGLKITNADANSNYSHAELRLISKNGASYGVIYNDHANSNVRIGHNTTGNTLEVFNDGVIRSQGIKFGNDTASANNLDDYEEGTWTPTTPIGAMQTVHGAHYTKIGRMVNVQAYVTMPTSSSSTTSSITGFPFTALGSSHYAIGAAYCQWQGNDHFFIQMSPGSATAHPHYGLGYGISFATASGKYLLFSLTYYTA